MKTPDTRLLDMLCGWYEFLDKDVTPDSVTATMVYELYQDAFAAQTPEAVEAFVKERVLPLLLKT